MWICYKGIFFLDGLQLSKIKSFSSHGPVAIPTLKTAICASILPRVQERSFRFPWAIAKQPHLKFEQEAFFFSKIQLSLLGL